jgi:hypothetical protein
MKQPVAFRNLLFIQLYVYLQIRMKDKLDSNPKKYQLHMLRNIVININKHQCI